MKLKLKLEKQIWRDAMADLEAGKLTVVNFKLISQMVSNSGVAGKSPGYIGNIKKKKKNILLQFSCEM